MKRRSISLRTKLTALILSLVVLTLGAGGGLSVMYSRDLLVTGLETSAHHQLESLVQTIQGSMSGLGKVTAALATSPAVQTYDEKLMEPQIRSLLEQNLNVGNIYVGSEKTGQIFVILREGKEIKRWVAPADFDPRTRDWYKDAKSKNGVIYTPPYQDKGTGQWVVTVAAPFKELSGAFGGVVGFDVMLTELTELVSSQKFGETGYAFMVDGTGVFLAHPDKKLLTTKITEMAGRIGEVGKEMITGKTGTELYDYNGEEKQIFFRPVPLLKWALAVTIPESEVQAPVASLINRVLLIGLVSVLVAAVLVFLFARGIIRPIVQVGSQLETVAKGGGDLTQRINVATRDEVGLLGQFFNSFMAKLGSIITDVMGSATMVGERSEQVAQAVRQQAEVTAQMAALVSDVARGAQEQNLSVAAAQESMESVRSAMAEIAEGAGHQAETAEECRSLAREMAGNAGRAVEHIRSLSTNATANVESAGQGHQAVTAVVTSMETLQSGMSETLSSVSLLDEGSRQIGAIVETIGAIAAQTNLLALNAAIEAARAGEHGKGFAVVAEEVRALAEKSHKSTGEIAGIIKKLSAAILVTVQSVQNAGSKVEEGSRLAREAGRYLDGIERDARTAGQSSSSLLTLAQELDRQAKSVESAMAGLTSVAARTSGLVAQMKGSTDQVSSAVTKVSMIGQANAASAEEGAASAEELNAALEEMAATAGHLAGAADGLKKLVGQFKV